MILVLVLLFAAVLTAQEPEFEPVPKENPHTAAADLERGAKLFFAHCAVCHGPQGDGGRGANLARPRLRRVADDQALYRLVRDGIPGTEMPGAWQMTPREIWQTVAHLRSLGRLAPESIPGDAARGRELFAGKGKCASCHTVAGKGGRTGPELTEIGSRRSAAHLRAAMLNPEATLPEGFLQVRVATRDGRRLTGIRLNEDTYTIQLRDLSDRLHSFLKTDLSEIQRDRGKSPMPAYRGVLTDAEIDDLTAYLVSLRGES